MIMPLSAQSLRPVLAAAAVGAAALLVLPTPAVAEPRAPQIPLSAGGVQQIVTGTRHSCALTEQGRVFCWGSNASGQLGNGTTEPANVPVEVVALGRNVRAIAVGGSHSCAIDARGRVFCWGSNSEGQLGTGDTSQRTEPARVIRTGVDVQAITAGLNHTCMLNRFGRALCWGRNANGQLGDTTTQSRNTATPVEVLGRNLQAITAGGEHTCALNRNGRAFCWGSNWAGQVGDGSTDDRVVPTRVQGLAQNMSAIAGGLYHTCALNGAGRAFCWGYNRDGQLGNRTTEDQPVRVRVAAGRLGVGLRDISAGFVQSCALDNRGRAFCWGGNRFGALGDGTTESRLRPVQVGVLRAGLRMIDAGGNYTCALNGAGRPFCWGDNRFGQLGDGTLEQRNSPTRVEGDLHQR